MCFPLKITRGVINWPSAKIDSIIDTHSRSSGDYIRVFFFKASPSLTKFAYIPNVILDSSIFQVFSTYTPLAFRTVSKRLSLNPLKWVVRLSIRASQLDQLDQGPAPNNTQCSCTDLYFFGPDRLGDRTLKFA